MHSHHHAESVLLFPALRRANPALNPVVDKLEADHASVSDLLGEVETAARELSGAEDPAVRARLTQALQQLSADQQITLNPAIGQSWVLYIRPNDLDDLHARLTEAGFPVTEISETSYGAAECFVPDPDGYELWLSVPAAHGDDDDEEDDSGEAETEDDEDYDDEDDDEEEEEWKVRH